MLEWVDMFGWMGMLELPSAHGVLWCLLQRKGAVLDSLGPTQTLGLLVALRNRLLALYRW